MNEREKIIRALSADRVLAHAVLFKHRHTDETPPFHIEMIENWHSSEKFVELMAFRGGAKSTISEEAYIVEACLQLFHNGLVLGSNGPRANERLASIKYELETNEAILQLFGDLKGPTWNEDKVVLSSGTCIQAYGCGMSLRGSKHLQWRPDRVLGDDMEEEENVATPEAREKMSRWFYSVVLPALDPHSARVRVAATPLDPNALAVRLLKDPKWKGRRYPIEYKGPNGERVAMWGSRFPLEKIDELRDQYYSSGRSHDFQREYMCEPEDPATKAFTEEIIHVEPTVRAWHPCMAFYDPARTAKSTSATTGKVVFSWVGPKLIVWEGTARRWMPNEIVDDIFAVNQEYAPILIGVEEDGLNEFLMQPLRTAMTTRNTIIPVRPYAAPRDQRKRAFIEALQPFFKAGEVIFAKDLPELKSQLLSFPTGEIDAPNALAYALKMRPGQPIYDSFGRQHVVENMLIVPQVTPWLVVNATPYETAAALVQFYRGQLRVVADWVREGDPGTTLADIAAEARIEAQGPVKLSAPLRHFDVFDGIGMVPAARKATLPLARGGPEQRGREEIRSRLLKLVHGVPGIVVGDRAKWVLNAFAGGYAREVTKKGPMSEEAQEGIYRTLMEGLESFSSFLHNDDFDGADTPRNYATDGEGRRYLTARPGR